MCNKTICHGRNIISFDKFVCSYRKSYLIIVCFVFCLVFLSDLVLAEQSNAFDAVLFPGWNFVSAPYAGLPVSADLSNCGTAKAASIFPAIYHYNPSTGNYDAVSAISDMKPGLGYWVYLDSDVKCIIQFQGNNDLSHSMIGDYSDGRLSAGWNQIGGTTKSVQLTSDENNGNCDIGIIYEYEPSIGEYAATETISAGNSYWIYVTKACSLDGLAAGNSDTSSDASSGYDGLTRLFINSTPTGFGIIISDEAGHEYTTKANQTPFNIILPQSNYTMKLFYESYDTTSFDSKSLEGRILYFELNSSEMIIEIIVSPIIPSTPVIFSLKIDGSNVNSQSKNSYHLDGRDASPSSGGDFSIPLLPLTSYYFAKYNSPNNPQASVFSTSLLEIKDPADLSSSEYIPQDALTGSAVSSDGPVQNQYFLPSIPEMQLNRLIISYDALSEKEGKITADAAIVNFAGRPAPIEYYFEQDALDETSEGYQVQKNIKLLPKYISSEKAELISAEIPIEKNAGDISFKVAGQYYPEGSDDFPLHADDIYSGLNSDPASKVAVMSAKWPDVEINIAKPQISSKILEKRKVVDLLLDSKEKVYSIAALDKDDNDLKRNLAVLFSQSDNLIETILPEETKYHEISLGELRINVVPTHIIYELNRADPSGPLLPKTCTNTCPKKIALTGSFSCSTDCVDYTIESSRKIYRNYFSALVDSKDNINIFFSEGGPYSIKVTSYYPDINHYFPSDVITTNLGGDTFQYVVYDSKSKSFLAKHEVASLCAPYSSSNTRFFIDPKDNLFITETCPYDCEDGKCPAMSYSQYTKTRVLNKNSFTWEKVPALGTDAPGTPIFDIKGNMYQFSGFGYTKYVVGSLPSQSSAQLVKVVLNQNQGKRVSDPNNYVYGLPGDVGTTPLGMRFDEEDNLCAIYSTGTNPDKTHSYYYAKISPADDQPVLLSKTEMLRTTHGLSMSMLTCNDILAYDSTEDKTYLLQSLRTAAFEQPDFGWFKIALYQGRLSIFSRPLLANKYLKTFAFAEEIPSSGTAAVIAENSAQKSKLTLLRLSEEIDEDEISGAPDDSEFEDWS